jgi:hypothetical protein
VEIHQSIKVQAMVEAQRKVMEIKRRESKVVAKKTHAILDKATFMKKAIKIPNPERFMWTQTK